MFDVKDSDFFEMEEDAFDTIVEDDITFRGNIKVVKPFMIRGKVTGNVESQSDIVIDTMSVVEADICADRVLIKGNVKGNVKGTSLVFVTSSGSLDGDISTKKVVLEPGCSFSGKCTMINS